MQIETCDSCNRKYEVREIGGDVPGGKEKEPVECPYCGSTYYQMTSGIYKTHALPKDKQ